MIHIDPKKNIKSIFSYLLFILISSLLLTIFCGNAQSTDTDELITIANERANQALGKSEKAFEKALDAETVAREALSNSKIATVLSNERFSTIRDFLYIISLVMGIFLIVTSLYEFNRKRIEQNRYNDLMKRQEKFDSIQIQLGKKSVDKFDERFQSQVDSISKLGSIIELVEKTFKNQSEASEELSDLIKEVKELRDVVEKQKLFNLTQFEKLYSDIIPFTKLSRMEWAWITREEQIHIERALSRFETIDEIILNEIKEREKVPQTCFLLGVGAFYRNDIITALNYLKKAINKYDDLGGFNNIRNTEHHFPYAFAHHFLGILEKNWWHDTVSLDVNKQKSKEYLEKAKNMLESKEGEFLTPVTFAEVLTYIEAERNEAIKQLQKNLKKLQNIKNKDKNQEHLVSRIYLYLGNIEYLNNDLDKAYEYYDNAIKNNEDNFYAWFSKASLSQALEKTDYNDMYQVGLKLLNKSSALTKPEITTHITLLAWAVIASVELKDNSEEVYRNQFKTAINRVRRVGSRVPLFFGPTSKQLVDHKTLFKEVDSKLKSSGNKL